MEYFDSDVIFNFLVLQDDQKHQDARRLVFESLKNATFKILTLVVQEVGYGLSRFGISDTEILTKLTYLTSREVIEIKNSHIIRALQLAREIGFKHINDCIHTAIAESINPDKFYTYNKADFKRIQLHTTLEITIL